MRDAELLAEWIQELAQGMRGEVGELSSDELAWLPGPQMNSIGVTVWHVSRWLDLLAVRALGDRPPDEEQWHTRGWAAKTGYDPRGIGSRGFGTVTGYTWEEVQAVPALPAADLLAYLDQVCGALRESILALPPDALHQPAPGLGGKQTSYEWVKSILQGCFAHLGEITTIKTLRARAA